ncbi:MAG: CBS domain-containing protein, partial [Candidatus Omnitrophica bacterium]|nr:CBS domain-containing protein [Candidatus Omnitrophota bacterium]
PIFIPESKKIDDLLKLFLKEKANIAVVLDEYGGTEGMITLEDVVEEIFGEIYDEFESVQEPVRKISKNSWRVYGKTPIKTVNIELGLDIPEDEDTIAGFLLSKAEKIPKAGEKFKFNIFKNSTNRQKKVEFEIERATVRRIVSVIIVPGPRS